MKLFTDTILQAHVDCHDLYSASVELKLEGGDETINELLVKAGYASHSAGQKLDDSVVKSVVIASSLPPPEVSPHEGQHSCLVIEADSPDKFYVQLVENVENISNLANNLQAHYARISVAHLPKKSEVVVARFHLDKAWYRAEVLEIQGGQCKVFFLDYGNVANVKLAEIRSIDKKFVGDARQALACRLAGVQLIAGQVWKPEVITSQPWNMLIQHRGEDMCEVELMGSDGVSVADTLIQQGILCKEDSTPLVMVSSLRQADFPHGVSLCQLTDVEGPQSFTLQIAEGDNAAKSCTLSKELKDHYDTVAEVYTPKKVGELVVARYVDSNWYRAEVLQIHNNIKIYYIDYGNKEEVHVSAIRAIKSSFLEYPILGLTCTLAGMALAPGKVASDCLQAFHNHQVRRTGELEGKHQVILYEYPPSDNLVPITDHLIMSGILVESARLAALSPAKPATMSPVKPATPASRQSPLRQGATPPTKTQSPLRQGATPPTKMQSPLKLETPHAKIQSPPSTMVSNDILMQNFDCRSPEGMIYHINTANSFHVQSVAVPVMSKFQELSSRLQEECSRQRQMRSPATPGQLLGALNPGDNTWYRAEVLKVKQTKARVAFIDYGDTNVVEMSEMRLLPAEFLSLPLQAIHCGLEGEFTPEQTDLFGIEFINQKVCLQIDKKRDGKYIVSDIKKINGVSACDILGLKPAPALTSLAKAATATVKIAAAALPPAIPSIGLDSGDVRLVLVSHIESPDLFFVGTADETTIQMNQTLMVQMHNLYSRQDSKPYQPQIDEYVAGSYQECFFRAKVLAVRNTTATLYFIDYGNTEEVTFDLIRPLQPQFTTHTQQAISCMLDKDLACQWMPDATNIFKQKALEKGFTMAVKSLKEGKVCVTLESDATGDLQTHLVTRAVVSAPPARVIAHGAVSPPAAIRPTMKDLPPKVVPDQFEMVISNIVNPDHLSIQVTNDLGMYNL